MKIMISFIIIGRNEGWKLTKCFESVSATIKYNQLNDYEIIYVDSKSTDDSIVRAKRQADVKILCITGDCNAAIARNIGAKESKGDILFFIDGDMEIKPIFLQKSINAKGELINECVTGHLDDIFYDNNNVFLGRFPRTYNKSIPEENEELVANGGIFIIKQKNWIQVNGMRTKYKVCEDLDLTIRLKKNGIKTIRIPSLIALHNTIDCHERMWTQLFSGNEYYPVLLFKNHLLNYKVVLFTIRSHYTSFLLIFLFLTVFSNTKLFIVSCILYLSVLFLKVFVNTLKAATSKNKISYFIERIFLQTSRDIIFWFAFLFFYPSEKKAEYTLKK